MPISSSAKANFALARVAQEHGEDVDSDRLLALPTEAVPLGERQVQ